MRLVRRSTLHFVAALCAAVMGVAALGMAAGRPARADEVFHVVTWKMPPYAMTDDQGKLTGFEVEIARTLCASLQIRCDIEAVSFPEVLDGLDRRTIDFAVASVLKTPERAQKYLFTDRYKRASSSFVGRAGEWPVGPRPVLTGKRIAVVRGSKQLDWLRTHAADGIVLPMDDQEEAVRAVLDGRADLTLAPTTVTFHLLTSDEGQVLEAVGDPLTEGGMGGEVGVTLPRGREELRDRLNQALRAMLSDGRYDAISSRFLPFRIY